MGVYDRDYYRPERQGLHIGGDWSAVTWLIVINAGFFLIDGFADKRLREFADLDPALLHQPWKAYQLLTFGFAHWDLPHVLFNMLGLFIFGREVEGIYGRAEFFRVYLTMIVVSGVAFLITQWVAGSSAHGLGASGAVMGMMALFVCHFPRRMIYIWGVFPVPAIVLGGLYILQDLFATISKTDNIAHTAHLAGAAFGYLYYRTGWNLGHLVPTSLLQAIRHRGPKLRVHSEEVDEDRPKADLGKQVDEILEKISREGEASLTREERRTLEDASRRYRQRR